MKGSHQFIYRGRQWARLGILLPAVIVAIFICLGCGSNGKVEESGSPTSVVDTTVETVSNGVSAISSALNEIPDFLPSYPSFGLVEGYEIKQLLDIQGRVVKVLMTQPEGVKQLEFDFTWDGQRLTRQILKDVYKDMITMDTIDFEWKGNVATSGGPIVEELEVDESGRVVRRIVGTDFPTSVLMNTYEAQGGLKQQVRCYRDGLNMVVRYSRFSSNAHGDSGHDSRTMRYVDTEIDAEDFDESWPEIGIGIFKFPEDFDNRAKSVQD